MSLTFIDGTGKIVSVLMVRFRKPFSMRKHSKKKDKRNKKNRVNSRGFHVVKIVS